MNYPPVNGVEIISATTSGGASTLALDIVRRHIAQAAAEAKEDDGIDYETADEGFSQRKPLNPFAKAARKIRNRQQKASRRANR